MLVTEYLGERLYRAAVAEIDGRGEGMPGKVEAGLPYATVLLVETGEGTVTDAGGYFRFKKLSAGECDEQQVV